MTCFELELESGPLCSAYPFHNLISFSGEIYRWTDEKGVVHFTDDVSKVPARYRSQVDKREVTEEIPKKPRSRSTPGPGPEVSARKNETTGKARRKAGSGKGIFGGYREKD